MSLDLRQLAGVLLRAASRLLDTDGDGKVELSDMPGAIEKAASAVSTGEALVAAGRASIEALVATARAGRLHDAGVVLTAEDVKSRWQQARAGYTSAADRVRAELAAEAARDLP